MPSGCDAAGLGSVAAGVARPVAQQTAASRETSAFRAVEACLMGQPSFAGQPWAVAGKGAQCWLDATARATPDRARLAIQQTERGALAVGGATFSMVCSTRR